MPVKAAALGSFTKVGRLAIQLVSLLFSFFRKENEKSILSKKKTKTLEESDIQATVDGILASLSQNFEASLRD